MRFLSRESKPIVWLVLYWASQWLLAAGWILFTKTEWGTQWLAQSHEPPHRFVVLFAFGWLCMLLLLPGACLSLARAAWWRRWMLAVAMVLSLEGLMWLLRSPERPADHYGDLSFSVWLPFLTSMVVWWLMTMLGRWRAVQEDEPVVQTTARTTAPLSLRDLFLAITLVALCIAPIHNMVVSWLRESTQMFDKLEILLALAGSFWVVPPVTLAMACIIRIATSEGGPSSAMVLLFWVLLAAWFGVLTLFQLSQDADVVVTNIVMFSLGAFLHVCLLGCLLRTLGYRIRSRSWWARS